MRFWGILFWWEKSMDSKFLESCCCCCCCCSLFSVEMHSKAMKTWWRVLHFFGITYWHWFIEDTISCSISPNHEGSIFCRISTARFAAGHFKAAQPSKTQLVSLKWIEMVRLVCPGSSEKWRDMASPFKWPKINGYYKNLDPVSTLYQHSCLTHHSTSATPTLLVSNGPSLHSLSWNHASVQSPGSGKSRRNWCRAKTGFLQTVRR